MNKEINNNGYDYVDLGLPSGTLWATMNVGASKPSEYGWYFQWGDTIGYTDREVGYDCGQVEFTWKYYKWNLGGDEKTFIKYKIPGATLELVDDAAHMYMGGDWKMPTPEQIQELIDNTTSNWESLEGVKGMKFTSKKDSSKSIFIPAAGSALNGSISLDGYIGNIWSSMLDESFVRYGQSLYFNSGGADINDYRNRCVGFSVRGVIDKSNNGSNDEENDKKDGLDLVEILKDVPKGTKLWSPLCGECELVAIEDDLRPIHCTYKRNIISTQFESYSETNIFFANDESVLFPSKDNKDWSTFKVSKEHKVFKPYQKVLIKDWFCSKPLWVAALYSHYDTLTNKHYLVGADWAEEDEIIPYKGNEDKLGNTAE